MPQDADLHIHSSFSDDGDCSIEEIFSMAENADLSAIAITDHDTTAAHTSILKSHFVSPVRYIPGIEITTMYPENSSQQHILGYFIDPENTLIREACGKVFNSRVDLAVRRMKALASCGLAADERDLFRHAGGLAPTATAVILSILENPDNQTNTLLQPYITGEKKNDRVSLFYRQFLAQGRPAYVPFRSIPTNTAVEAILSAGGVPVLAHPGFTKTDPFLDTIRLMGIAGLEVHSSYHSEEETEKYSIYAEKHGLIATAGSDFHGSTAKPHVKMGQRRGSIQIVNQMEEWIEKRK